MRVYQCVGEANGEKPWVGAVLGCCLPRLEQSRPTWIYSRKQPRTEGEFPFAQSTTLDSQQCGLLTWKKPLSATNGHLKGLFENAKGNVLNS